jgi:GT2 family glycosyltransferase
LSTILVDNASSDGTVEAVRAGFPGVEVLVNDENLGFAEGNNVGIRRALEGAAAWVLLLNNDVEVEPGFLRALLEEAERRPDAGALGPLILFGPPSELIWFAGASYDPRKGYNGRQRGYGEPAGPPFDEVWQTDRICGAAMLVPRTVLEEVGGFDTGLFAYYEDTDWSLRARAAGHRLYVVPAARIWHKVSRSSGGESSPATLYYGTRNALVVAERTAPLGPAGTWRRRSVLVSAHLVQALLSGRRREGVGAVLAGLRDFRAGRLGRRE